MEASATLHSILPSSAAGAALGVGVALGAGVALAYGVGVAEGAGVGSCTAARPPPVPKPIFEAR